MSETSAKLIETNDPDNNVSPALPPLHRESGSQHDGWPGHSGRQNQQPHEREHQLDGRSNINKATEISS
jgi:hypothetical protein